MVFDCLLVLLVASSSLKLFLFSIALLLVWSVFVGSDKLMDAVRCAGQMTTTL